MSEFSSDASSQAVPRRRRPRYSGTHPKHFAEKYKELDPAKYVDEAAKVRAQGRTPAGAHVAVMEAECLAALKVYVGARGVDATLGYGGHAAVILRAIGQDGFLWAFDQDPIERPRTEARLRANGFTAFETIAENFSELSSCLKTRPNAREGIDFLLADLGVSSMQLDDPARGFSKKANGPLDLRMNPNAGISGAEWLRNASVMELARTLRENSDEPRADRIALAIKSAGDINSTGEFTRSIRDEILRWTPSVRRSEGDAPIARAFQALRIEVNREFTALDRLLESLPKALKRGGRVVFLSFHSGEDRRVKKAFQAGLRAGTYSTVSEECLRAGPAERRDNPRSKSAKLRWAQRA